jgi:hypothetical protein
MWVMSSKKEFTPGHTPVDGEWPDFSKKITDVGVTTNNQNSVASVLFIFVVLTEFMVSL